MGLNASLSIATSGLAAVQAELAVASQNVANANTAGYAVEQSSISSRTANGQASGVVVGLTTRTINTALENSLYTQNATVSALTTTSSGLTTISALQGSTSSDSGSSNTLPDQIGNLQSSLITLDADPSSAPSQQAVVSAAGTLASTIQTTAGSYQAARQAAQDSIVDEVGTVNSGLALIGSLSDQIAHGRVTGISTADLENQRSSAMTSLSNVLSVKFTETSAGDMLVTTPDGLSLPTHASSGPLSTSNANVGVADAHPGSIPAITLNGRDVTTSLAGGSLGANIGLRDQVLPTMQAELDSFSQTLASRFDAQGLALFTDGSGNVPASAATQASPAGQLGFSNVIQVNPAVTGNPSVIRDGSHDVAGSTTGASSFTIDTARGTSDTTLIDRVLDYALGTNVQNGVTQPAAAATGLGANGTLSTPYLGSSDVASLASTLVSSQASTIGQASSSLSDETSIQTALTTKIASASGVSVDDQMASIVSLQNAYQANAKVVSAVQAMFTSLLNAIS